jgi:hypothetical protein
VSGNNREAGNVTEQEWLCYPVLQVFGHSGGVFKLASRSFLIQAVLFGIFKARLVMPDNDSAGTTSCAGTSSTKW